MIKREEKLGDILQRKTFSVKSNRAKAKARKVDNIADRLVEKFDAPGSRDFFCKCAWTLSEDEIWTIYEKVHRPGTRNALKYFIFLCQLKMS